MTTNHKPGEQAIRAAEKLRDEGCFYEYRKHPVQLEDIARIIQSEMGDVVELREALHKILLLRGGSPMEDINTARAIAQSALQRTKKALRLGEGK